MRMLWMFLTASAAGCLLYGETVLSGDISEVTFQKENNPYVVQGDIFIPPGKNVSIGKSCILLFKEYTGLVVSGNLLVDGTAESQTIFTSASDSLYNGQSGTIARPFGWNGISVDSNATAVFRHVRICFSSYGLKTASIRTVIEQSIFRQNGQYSFTVNGNIPQDNIPEDNLPYSFNLTNVKKLSQSFRQHGSIIVTTKPAGAQILIDGTPTVSVSPDTVHMVPAGKHRVQAIKGGLTASQEINLNALQTLILQFELRKERPALRITTDPPGFEVYVGVLPTMKNKPFGYTPLSLAGRDTVPIKVSLFKPGFIDTVIPLRLDCPGDINLKLQEADGRLSEWQYSFVRSRKIVRGVRISAFCGCVLTGITGGLLMAGGAGDFRQADDAKEYLEQSIIKNGRQWDDTVNDNKEFIESGNTKYNAGLVLCSISALFATTGIILTF